MDKITNLFLPESLQELSGEKFLGNLINTLIALFLIGGGIAVLFMLLVGGIQWMIAGGDKTATQAARGRITSALIGALILFSAFAIIKLIEFIFGINLLTIDFGPLILK